MATLEKRLLELEQRVGLGDEQRIIIVRFVKVGCANDGSPVETLTMMGGSMAWERGAEETEDAFMARVKGDLPRTGAMVLIAKNCSA